MIATTRASLAPKIASSIAVLLLASLSLGVATAAAEEATIVYKKESFNEYEQQLAASQIQSVTINKRLRSLRITLKDGTHVLAKYGRKEEPKVDSALQAKHVSVTILKPSEATKEAKATPKHHKLRYIAGGILVVVIVVVVAVLLFDRRRKARNE